MSAHSSLQRPPDELADLHIFVVPLELWLEKYRTAFNNIALESVSAGFVRVQPYISLSLVRDHIEEQLGSEVVPEDYVFLRSVGRCMAVVKENQERFLKAKDFLPPVSYTPEIFILPATHDSVARPVENAANTVIQTHGMTTAGMASMQPQHFPGVPAGYMQQPHADMLTGGYSPGQQTGQVDQTFRRSSRSTKSMSEDEGGSDADQETGDRHQSLEERRAGNAGDVTGLDEKRKKERKENMDENEDSTERILSKTKKQRMQKKGSDSSSGSNQSEARTVKFIQPEVLQNLPVPGQNGALISPPTPIPSGRVIASPLPAQQDKLATSGPRKDSSFDNQNNSGNSNTVEYEPVPDKKKKGESKAGKKKRRDRSRSPSLERSHLKEQEVLKGADYPGINEENFEDVNSSAVFGEVTVSRRETPPTLSEVEERSKFVQFPSPAKGSRRPVTLDENELGFANHRANGSHEIMNDGFGESNDPGVALPDVNDYGGAENGDADDEANVNEKLQDDNEKADKDGIKNVKDSTKKDSTRGNTNVNAAKGKKVAKKPTKKPTEILEDKFKIPQIPKVPTPPPMTYPKKGDKEMEKDTASAKDRKRHEIEELKAELRKAKNARVDMEKERESKVRRAKMLQNQMLQKRNQSKNIWKKKFFEEKRKTGNLDDQVNRLRHEVDVQHKVLMSYLESKEREGNKGGGGGDYKSPSEKTNQRMSLARLQHEVEELRRRIEELKMKLTVEMKNRDAAQKELKQIRQDLMEKKINLTLTKSQKSLATLGNPENIAV